MRIYIANLGKYNEGELVGAWFTPPVDFEEVKERIGLNDEYEEYAIHDYELPFAIDEYTPMRKSTACVKWWRTYRNTFRRNYQSCNPTLAVSKNSVSMKTILSAIPAVMIWRMWLATIWKKADSLGELPAHLQNYIDYAAYGRDMELEGTFVVTNHGVYEILR